MTVKTNLSKYTHHLNSIEFNPKRIEKLKNNINKKLKNTKSRETKIKKKIKIFL